jgi:hypothetical protein
MHATREEVGEFLAAFRFAIDFGECGFKGHPEVDRALVELGFTRRAALEEIKRLCVDDYSEGPTADHAEPSKEVWVFGQRLEGTELGTVEVYIKLRLTHPAGHGRPARGFVWSFHRAKHPMRYPFRKEPKGRRSSGES